MLPAACSRAMLNFVAGPIRIDVVELRLACNKVLDAVAERFGPEVALAERSFLGDHYWDLTLEASFGLVEDPERHVVAGQTSDDVEELRSLVERDEVFLWHDIAHLTGVLRRIASLDLPGDGSP